MTNFERYNALHGEVMKRLEDGEITVEMAKDVTDLAFDKYITESEKVDTEKLFKKSVNNYIKYYKKCIRVFEDRKEIGSFLEDKMWNKRIMLAKKAIQELNACKNDDTLRNICNKYNEDAFKRIKN